MGSSDLGRIVPNVKDQTVRRALLALNQRIDRLRALFEGVTKYNVQAADIDADTLDANDIVAGALSGVLKAAAGAVAAAIADTDYQQPITWGNGLTYSGPTASLDLVADGGLEISSGELQLSLKSAGGLELDSGELALDIKAAGGIELDSGELALDIKAAGGVALDSGEVALDIGGLATEASPSGSDTVAIYDGGDHKEATLAAIWLAGFTQQSSISDASESHAITDPGDTPADADALRDDLVANTIPAIESALNDLGAKVNLILDAMDALGLIA